MTLVRTLIVVLILGTGVLGYPPQERLMPDGAPVPEDVDVHEDSVASASENEEDYADRDDSDMYMEPEEGAGDSQVLEVPAVVTEERRTEDGMVKMPLVATEERRTEGSEIEESLGSTEERRTEDSMVKVPVVATVERRTDGNMVKVPVLAMEERRTEDSEVEVPVVGTEDEGKNSTSSIVMVVDSEDQEAKNTEENSSEFEKPEKSDKSLETESQNFFPSFAELFSNHRLPFAEQQQQQRYRPNRFLGYFQRDRSAYQGTPTPAKDQHHLLGSGNFGVIRGGTYYPEDKETEEYSVDESLYSPYYHGGTGRSRSNYYRNPKPQPVRGGDFFANFRDFADITAPPKSSFSHLSVVYANKNGSATGRITEPRNIIETLRMLEEEEESNLTMSTTEVPRKKLSKSKRKLIKMRQYDEDKARRSRMSVEPLLALS